ncbi:hypothetical protein BHM03_00025053 [Ensete ventricosum]|nr:hypothetical protein BHM03_00025053 [Ensete ventricosum]
MVINFREVACSVEFRSVFHVPSQKFKILSNPNVLAHGKSYEHGFTKKCDGHKIYVKSRAESSFDLFYVQSQKFKILAILDGLAHMSRVSIGFSCTVSEIQNTGHSRCITP